MPSSRVEVCLPTKGMQMGGTRADLGEPNTKPNWRVWMQLTGIGRQARPNNQIEIDGIVSA